jgi:hypothetical protein
MAFDIHALDKAAESGEIDEGTMSAYLDDLMELFAASPEGQARQAVDPEMGFWSHAFVEYGHGYLGVTPPSVTADGAEEILTEIFPRKLSVPSVDETAGALPELIAFWEYLGREHRLPNAPAILRYLQSVRPEAFGRWMMDPSRSGMAKSFVMAAQAEGYDVTDTESMNEFMASYNARLQAAGPAPGLPDSSDLDLPFAPGLPFSPALSSKNSNRGRSASEKKRRKMAAASRKKNRRRK